MEDNTLPTIGDLNPQPASNGSSNGGNTGSGGDSGASASGQDDGVNPQSSQQPIALVPEAQGVTLPNEPQSEQKKEDDLGKQIFGEDPLAASTTGFYSTGNDYDLLANLKIPSHPNTKFDEKIFIQLLAGSISLTIDEKKKIVESIPKLSQYQIDELMRILEEEKQKFAELNTKHTEQLKELEQKQLEGLDDVNLQKEQQEKVDEDARKAEAIRKNLGI